MTETQTAATCETFADHDFSEPRVILAARHPTRGNYQLTKRKCAKCGRAIVETVWMREPPRGLDRA